MSNNEFYLEGANLSYRNALAHYRAARHLATHVNLGIANSHLILGAEEAIKALVLCRKHAGDKISDDKFRPFFTDHKYKHGFLKRSLRKIDPMHKMYLIVMSAISNENAIQHLEKEHGIKMTKREFLKLARARFNTEEEEKEHRKIAQWLNRANEMKNAGLYIGLSPNNDKWLSPKSITKEELKESMEIVRHIIKYYVGPWIGLYSAKVISGNKDSDNYLKP